MLKFRFLYMNDIYVVFLCYSRLYNFIYSSTEERKIDLT